MIVIHREELHSLTAHVKKLEDTVTPLVNLPLTVNNLKEVVEERTNEQLRETLIFKNIPEIENEKWEDTRKILAEIISNNINTIS